MNKHRQESEHKKNNIGGYICHDLHCKCPSPKPCMEGPSCEHSGRLYSGRRSYCRHSDHPTHLDRHEIIKISTRPHEGSLTLIPSEEALVYLSLTHRHAQEAQQFQIQPPLYLLRSLRGACVHTIPRGSSCCSHGHQRAGHRGRVAACPWASSGAHSWYAPRRGCS